MPRSPARALLLLAAAAVLAAGPARADDPQPPLPLGASPQAAPPAPDQERRGSGNWYGWQTLLAVAPFDIAMFAGLSRSGETAGSAAFATGFAGRALAPAVVHLAHRRWGTAFGTIGLHAATTATGVAIGYGVGLALQSACPPRAPCRNGFRDMPPGPGYGAIAGSMAGTVLDVVFLAYRQKLSWTAASVTMGPHSVAPVRTAWGLAPYAAPSGAGLCAAGMF